MENHYNVGIVGCGFIAEMQVEALRRIPGVKIVGLVTRRKETSAAFKKKMQLDDCQCFQDYDRLISMEEVDFISISVPNKLHKEVLFAAARAGKHVICEKPVANNLKDIDEMIEIMDKEKLKFAVYHEAAFYPENLLIKELFDKGVLSSTKFAWNGALAIGKWNWDVDSWRMDPAISGGGVMTDEGVHLGHLLKIYFDNKKPLYATAVIDRLGKKWSPCEDTATMIFEFPMGLGVSSTSFQPSIGREQNMKTYSQGIIAEEGSIELIFGDGAEGVFSPVEKVLVTTSKGVKEYKMPSYSWPLEKNTDAFTKLYLDFIDCVNDDRQPYVNAKSARDAMEMVMACYKSAALGRKVKIPMDSADPVYVDGVLGLKKLESEIPADSVLRSKRMYGLST